MLRPALSCLVLLVLPAFQPALGAIADLQPTVVLSQDWQEIDTPGLERRAASLAATGNFAAASELQGELVKRAPQRQDYWQNWADWSLTARRFGQAVNAYKALLGINPANRHAHINLVLALTLGGDTEQARHWLGSLDREALQSAEQWRNLGIAEQMLGDCRAAQASLQRALGRAPNDAVSWASLARCQSPSDARQSLQRAAELRPGWISPHLSGSQVSLQPAR